MANADNILVGSGGAIYVAPVGTTLPTEVEEALNGAFVDLGYISEDGISLSATAETTDISAFQSFLPVRRLVTGRTFDLSMSIREWTEGSIVLAFGGGTVTEDNPGEYTYTPPAAGDALYERAMVVDWRDGDKKYRLVVPRGTVSDSVETTIARGAAADLPITFSVLATDEVTPGYYLITDDPALTPAGS